MAGRSNNKNNKSNNNHNDNNSNSRGSHQKSEKSNPATEKQDNLNIDKKVGSNKSKASTTSSSSSSSSSVPPIWICVFVGSLSLLLGLFTPHLWQAWKASLSSSSPDPTRVRSLEKSLPENTESTTKKEQEQNQSTSTMTLTQENNNNYNNGFPCDTDALSQVLHEIPIPGMHVLCMNQTMTSLQLKYYKNAQQVDSPPVSEMVGIPEWFAFKSTITEYFQLQPMDDLHQPWAIFSPNGQLLCKEDNDSVKMEGFTRMGMVLIYQGGQFIWPGVRIGFKRTIELYSIMPAGSPDMGNKKRYATLETLSLEPLVFSVEGFLDDHECDWFKEEATPTLKYSAVTLMDMDKGRPASDFRTSQSTFLSKNSHPTVMDIDYRTASLVRVPRFHQENVQVLRYGGGEKYDAHHDYFDKSLYQNDISTLKNFIQYGRRNRFITVFWYLSDVEEGGETIFPRFNGAPQPSSMSDCDVGLKVKPTRGKVIIFYSLKADGTLDPLSLHGACPVKKGVKWAANKWVWNDALEFGPGR